MEMVYPSRPECYEELFAKAMSSGMKTYEREVCYYSFVVYLFYVDLKRNLTIKHLYLVCLS